MFIQETWLPFHETVICEADFPKYSFHFSSSDMFISPEDLLLQTGATWHGTALGWNKSIEKMVTRLTCVHERFCGIRYSESSLGFSITAYTVYFPTSGKDEEFLEVIELLKRDIIENMTESCTLVIGTDSNVSTKSSRRRIAALELFLEFFSLKTLHNTEHPTFHHNNGTSESQIDHIYVSTSENHNVKITMKSLLCLKENSDNVSSHDVILGLLHTPSVNTAPESKSMTNYTDFQVLKPKWNTENIELYQNNTAEMLEQLIQRYNSVDDIPILCEMFSKTLVLSAETNFDTVKVTNFKRRNIPKFSKELQKAHKDHKKSSNLWRIAGRPTDPLHPSKFAMQETRKQLQRREDCDKETKLHDDIMENFVTDRNAVY